LLLKREPRAITMPRMIDLLKARSLMLRLKTLPGLVEQMLFEDLKNKKVQRSQGVSHVRSQRMKEVS
jgi:hypothetical protein